MAVDKSYEEKLRLFEQEISTLTRELPRIIQKLGSV